MKSNMYSDAIYIWNVIKGCYFRCIYCLKSYQKMAKREMHRCLDCYNYIPHIHEERLEEKYVKDHFPKETPGDSFIWACSSGDISFAKRGWIEKVLQVVRNYPKLTFFFQTKNPKTFFKYDFPNNCILGITLETDLDKGYSSISKAPLPSVRMKNFLELSEDYRKSVTIEPILQYSIGLLDYLSDLTPERIYIGYDTKNCKLHEPWLFETQALIRNLKGILPECKIKTKLIRKAWFEKE